MAEYIIECDEEGTILLLPGMKLAERIVRCIDCIYCERQVVNKKRVASEPYRYWCHSFEGMDGESSPVESNGFCAWGERRSI